MKEIRDLPTAVRAKQLAEEAGELSVAALKLARVLEKESPTPVSEGEAYAHLTEEAADVYLCMAMMHELSGAEICAAMTRKKERWEQRIN